MNIKQAVEQATTKLSSSSDSANLDARLLTCLACGIAQTKLITEPERTLSENDENVLTTYLDRRAKGEPLAYIVGEKEFWSLNFKVNKHVLIPRPETELLVELALKKIANDQATNILELGTGSGAIAIAIAKQCPNCNITATDNSQHALEVATKNAHLHNVEINYIQSNWFENITSHNFDLIISNPPYIDKNDPNLENFVYQFEPRDALISKDNGLFDLAEIISNASSYLKKSGQLIVEHGFQQAESVQQLMSNAHLKNIKSHKDLNGHFRCTSSYS